jgi:phenylpropionate dioxygenase-like ring-hydroxylating dioxygenase large terminal subunit
MVETASRGHRTRFVCPYHGWTYGLDGELLRMTDEDAFAGLAEPPTGLRPVAVVEKYGLIFVRIAAGPQIDIDAFLGPMAQELEALNLAQLRYFATKQTALRCNWKLMQEGSLETYHFNTVHAQSIALQFNGMAHIFDLFGDHQRFVVPRRKLMERYENGAATRDQMLPTYFIFPNTALTVPHDHLMLVQVFPRDIRTCLFENALLTRSDSGERDPGHWQRALDLTQGVNSEDFAVVESIQRAYDVAPPERVIHGRYEQGLTAFNAAIDRALARDSIDATRVIGGLACQALLRSVLNGGCSTRCSSIACEWLRGRGGGPDGSRSGAGTLPYPPHIRAAAINLLVAQIRCEGLRRFPAHSQRPVHEAARSPIPAADQRGLRRLRLRCPRARIAAYQRRTRQPPELRDDSRRSRMR